MFIPAAITVSPRPLPSVSAPPPAYLRGRHHVLQMLGDGDGAHLEASFCSLTEVPAALNQGDKSTRLARSRSINPRASLSKLFDL